MRAIITVTRYAAAGLTLLLLTVIMTLLLFGVRVPALP